MTTSNNNACEIFDAIGRANTAMSNALIDRGVWSNLTASEYAALDAIVTAPTSPTMNDINVQVPLSQPGFCRLIDRLEARGLVTRCPDANDGRARQVRITNSGQVLHKEVHALHSKAVNEVLGALTPSELALLHTLTLKLARDGSA